jgi:hypothetical protein
MSAADITSFAGEFPVAYSSASFGAFLPYVLKKPASGLLSFALCVIMPARGYTERLRKRRFIQSRMRRLLSALPTKLVTISR